MDSLHQRPASHNSISGRELRRGSAVTRVLAGVHAHNGGLNIKGLSYRKSAQLTNVSRTLISLVDKAGSGAIEALERGEVTLSRLRAAHETKSQSERISRYIEHVGVGAVIEAIAQGQVTDADAIAQRLVEAFGVDVCAAVLDRVTAPPVATTTD